MFLFAWSLVQNAVEYSRRQRLVGALSMFMASGGDSSCSTLICRRIKPCKSLDFTVISNISDRDICENVLYSNGALEIITRSEKIILQASDWKLCRSFLNADVKYFKHRVNFIVRIIPNAIVESKDNLVFEKNQPSSSKNSKLQSVDDELTLQLDDVAHLIAQHTSAVHLFFYESTLDSFYDIVYSWSNHYLHKDTFIIEEIYTVQLPNLSNLQTSNFMEWYTVLDQPQSFEIESGDGMSLSRCSFISNSSESQPYTLLETLYLKELFGEHFFADFARSRRKDIYVWNDSSNTSSLAMDICRSDTCLDKIGFWRYGSERKRKRRGIKSYGSYFEEMWPSPYGGHFNAYRNEFISRRIHSTSPPRILSTPNHKTRHLDDDNINTVRDGHLRSKFEHSLASSMVPNYFRRLRKELENVENLLEIERTRLDITSVQSNTSQSLNLSSSGNSTPCKSAFCNQSESVKQVADKYSIQPINYDSSLSANDESKAFTALKDKETHELVDDDGDEFFAQVEQEIFKESTIRKASRNKGCQRSASTEETKGTSHSPTVSTINDNIHESVTRNESLKNGRAKLSPTAPTRSNSTKPRNNLVSTHTTNDNIASLSSKTNVTAISIHTTPVHTATISHYEGAEFKRSMIQRDRSSESISTILRKNNDNKVSKKLSSKILLQFPIRKRFSSLISEHDRFKWFGNRMAATINNNNNCKKSDSELTPRTRGLSISSSYLDSSSMAGASTLLDCAHRNIFDRASIRQSVASFFTSDFLSAHRAHTFPRRKPKLMHEGVDEHRIAERRMLPNSIQEVPPLTGASNAWNSQSGSQRRKSGRPSAKPPSILVYAGNRTDLFEKISVSLTAILPDYVYAIRDLSVEALKNHPWTQENCACLVISDTDMLDDAAWVRLQEYFVNSGKILFVCQNALLADLTQCDSSRKRSSVLKNIFDRKAGYGTSIFGKEFEQFLKKALKCLEKNKEVNEIYHAKDVVGGYSFSVVFFKKTDQPLLFYMQNPEQRACALFSDATTDQLLNKSELIADVMSRLGIEVLERPKPDGYQLSQGYLICQKDRLILDIKGLSYGKMFEKDRLRLLFRLFSPKNQKNEDNDNEEKKWPEASDVMLPIEICQRKKEVPPALTVFDHATYFEFLKTKQLGRVALFVPVCTSTIDVVRSLSKAFSEFDGILVTTLCQTKGRGRNRNVWLSPKGCAMFTFNFNVPASSELGKSIGFIQHILAVSIVDAILTLLNDEKFPLRIKWPNDIYYERKYKIAGVLVSAAYRDNVFECNISAGINVANEKPTVCINDLLPKGKASLTVEEVIAGTLNKFEHYVNYFVKEGKMGFQKRYCQFWMHNQEEVTIMHKENFIKEKVIIRGIDANGYLEVRSKLTNQVFSVQDDGNTFDMMKGLIHPK